MADSVAYQHTDGNRNHDGRDLVYGVKSEEWDCQNLVVPFFVQNQRNYLRKGFGRLEEKQYLCMKF